MSEPVEDENYPYVGDPGVDALHYELDLAWAPESHTLEGVETLVFRATADAERFQLDFGEPLTVSALTLDGDDQDFEEDGKNLVVASPVEADQRYVLEIRYSGTPEPVPAPTTRTDFDTLGWQVTDTDETWTMQEPYGAYTWYAVNDQPSDKALYDFTLSTASPWVGVANGQLLSREESGGDTVTEWHLDEPASSYLVTVAFGDFTMTRARSASGVPMTYWTPKGDETALRQVRARRSPAGLDRAEARAVSLLLTRHSRRRRDERHGDPDDGDPRQQLLHPVAGGDPARDRAPVVRRPGDAAGLARPLDVRGHGDVPAGELGVRARGYRPGGRHRTNGPGSTRSRATRAGRRPTTTPPPSARATSTTSPP